MAGIKKMRYPCFTAYQQEEFDSWNKKQQNYALFRAQGMDKANSYRSAGFAGVNQAGQNGYILENKTKPMMKEIIATLAAHFSKLDPLKKDSEYSKKIDKKAEEIKPELHLLLSKVPSDSPVVETKPVTPEKLTGEQARDIQFYRQIADGTLKSVTITKKYDKDNNLISKTVVEESSLETRIKAQKEIMRKCGIADILQIGDNAQTRINVLIVDASKKSDEMDTRDGIDGKLQEIDGEIALVSEKEERA